MSLFAGREGIATTKNIEHSPYFLKNSGNWRLRIYIAILFAYEYEAWPIQCDECAEMVSLDHKDVGIHKTGNCLSRLPSLTFDLAEEKPKLKSASQP